MSATSQPAASAAPARHDSGRRVIIDAHCHVFDYGRGWSRRIAGLFVDQGLGQIPYWREPTRTWRADDQDVDVDVLIRDLDDASVDRAVVFGVVAGPYDCYTDPALVADAAAKYPDRLTPFHAPDPHGGMAARRLVERAIGTLGFRGLKLLPAYNHMALNDPRLYPFYAQAEELGVPLIVHTGFTRVPGCRLEWQDPTLLDEVGAAFPELRLWLAHCGGHRWLEAFMVLSKYPSMAADLSYSAKFPRQFRAQTLSHAKHLGILPRLMWGTDYPFFGHAQELAWWRSLPAVQRRLGLEPILTDEDMAGLLGGNAARMLDL